MSREMFFCEFHNGHCVGEAWDCDAIHGAEYIYTNIERERCSFASFEQFGLPDDGAGATRGQDLAFYTILPSPILYGVWHKKGASVVRRILCKGRAIVLQ